MDDTGKFHFGNGTCSSIEVDMFTPVCSRPPVDGTEPLALEVPVPVFYPVIPPVECACVKFAPSHANIAVTMHRGSRTQASGRADLEIKAAGDCCEGLYEITGPKITLDIPECLQPDGLVCRETYRFNSRDAGYGGSLTVEMYMKDCVPQIKLRGEPLTVPKPSIDIPEITIGSGGNVFQGDDDNFYTDASIDEDDDTWYGGGVGNTRDDAPGDVVGRGPGRRCGGDSECGPVDANSVPFLIQHVDGEYRLVSELHQYSPKWCSQKANEDKTGVEEITDAATGNLDMVMPSGFQWHDRGVAINLSEFLWSPGGLLNAVTETDKAVLVSPAPAIHSAASSLPGQNASGLCLRPLAGEDIEPGLRVKAGDGLRIFKADYRTGDREPLGSYNNRVGTLEVYGHSGDFLFNSDGKLVINDRVTEKSTVAPVIPSDSNFAFARDKDYAMLTGMVYPSSGWWYDEKSAPLLHCPLRDNFEAAGYLDMMRNMVETLASLYDYDPDTPIYVKDINFAFQAFYHVIASVIAWCDTWYLGVVHIGKAGTVLAVDDNAGALDPNARRYQNSDPNPDRPGPDEG